ncbi:helix-turn-helix transcriptional regulator [Kutzneria buriramensis]|uniref:Helix-turn-helix protein n=1 Tax=Kutzneria buriramensis TaxID=1045776 RepID=A0A3E0HEQ2_9PSEU|nr:winged helix-turn-helix domain-containing protein [Kutzneria buriramensis]REH43690.1 helix-turn-helix protein [Kutzneria buriramensis]
MALRIHFTAEDLARTSVAAGPDPMWEILLSGFRLREADIALEHRQWLREVRARRRLGPSLRLLSVLTPLRHYIPDFLTPDEGRDGFEAGLEALASTPRRRLRREVLHLARTSRVPDWIRPLADGDVTYLEQLCAEVRMLHEDAIAPYQEIMRGNADTDRSIRARAMLSDGVEGLFRSFGPQVQWEAPVLTVHFALDRDLYLNGRGLRLVPAHFSRHTLDALADPELAPVLVYPVDLHSRWTQLSTSKRGSLDALMGATRAAVMDAVEDGATTTELARRLGTSLSAVSRHTGVLRDAGLISTRRRGAAVLHTLTPLGRQLLDRQL